MIYATIKRAEPKRELRNFLGSRSHDFDFTIIYTVINVRPHDEGAGPISCHSQPFCQRLRPQWVKRAKGGQEPRVSRWKRPVQRIGSYEGCQ